MPYFGCHLSVAGGFRKMGEDALSIGATTFAYFTRNPRGGAVKTPAAEDVAALRKIISENRFGGDLARMDEILPGNLYNFHPGSHTGQGYEKGIELIVAALNEILPNVKHTTVLLEAMSGKGSEVGGTFEQLAEILSRVNCPEKMGVCLDTCHIYSAGYDIVHDLDGVLEQFDKIVGLRQLKAMHLNDSLTPFASHKDRHEKIGRGSLGAATFALVVCHHSLRDLPMILETPQDSLKGWAGEIAMLKNWAGMPEDE